MLRLNELSPIFIDGSVDTGGISDDLPDETIRELIRDHYLRETTVTILLVGTGTSGRKHVDWEVYSSMHDGTKNKKSGVLVIMLPSTGCTHFTAAHGNDEKSIVYPDCTSWTSVGQRTEYERRYPFMPDRIIDNLLASEAKVSVTTWGRLIADWSRLALLIELAHQDRAQCKYDLSRPMRRANS